METTHFSYRLPAKEDYPWILELCDERFGPGYISPEEYEQWLTYIGWFLVALWDGAPAGFAFVMPEPEDKLAAYFKMPVESIRAASHGKSVVHCRSAALKKEYEKNGIMTLLLQELIQKASKEGYGAAFAPAWKYNDFVPTHDILTKMGFTIVGEKKDIWYDLQDYYCIVCKGRCRCECVIYQKTLEEITS